MTAAGFVCAYRGSRDWYQAPLALAEAGRLDVFITDAYATPALRLLAKHVSSTALAKLAARYEPGIPDDRIECLWGTALREQIQLRSGTPPKLMWPMLDQHYSRTAAARARAHRADLLLYSSYAWEAFTASYPHQPRRVLFQYHPHVSMERALLDADAAKYPEVGESYAETDSTPLPETLARRERDCWQHADRIICSSSFTKRSLVAAGCSDSKCVVVPYGVTPRPVRSSEDASQGLFRALFVGSGGRRKGLHHLLQAWSDASLPRQSELTLVCRVLDRATEALIARTDRVRLLPGVSTPELERLYSSSSLFVMPSLVEGFGHVYLESLAHGCPVLGTENTCVPDLGGESDGVFVSEAGNTEALTAQLERLSALVPSSPRLRDAARATAARFPWTSFRQQLRGAVGLS